MPAHTKVGGEYSREIGFKSFVKPGLIINTKKIKSVNCAKYYLQ